MSISVVWAKRNDVGYLFTGVLTMTNEVDWTNASVRWIVREKHFGAMVSGTGVFTGFGDGTEGQSKTAEVSYTTVAGDLARAGSWHHEWEVTFSGGAIVTFPSRSYNTINIVEDLG